RPAAVGGLPRRAAGSVVRGPSSVVRRPLNAMIVLMHKGATAEQVGAVMELIDARGLRPVNMPGGDHVAVGVASAIAPELREPLANSLVALPGVDHVVHVSRPYKLASREFHA